MLQITGLHVYSPVDLGKEKMANLFMQSNYHHHVLPSDVHNGYHLNNNPHCLVPKQWIDKRFTVVMLLTFKGNLSLNICGKARN